MKIFQAFWRYWKWLCVALCTSFVLLGLLALLLGGFEMSGPDENIRACIDGGGAWNADTKSCERAG